MQRQGGINRDKVCRHYWSRRKTTMSNLFALPVTGHEPDHELW